MNDSSPSESTRDSSSTTLNTGEQSVQHSLSGEKWVVGSLLLGDWSRGSDRPELHHLVFGLLALEFCLQHDVLESAQVRQANLVLGETTHVNSVRTLLHNASDCSHRPWPEHDLVVVDQGVFVDGTEDVTSGDVVADLVFAWVEIP